MFERGIDYIHELIHVLEVCGHTLRYLERNSIFVNSPVINDESFPAMESLECSQQRDLCHSLQRGLQFFALGGSSNTYW